MTKLWRWLKAACGNSRTIAIAYSAELLGALDELKYLDWSQWFGTERAGRIMAGIGVVIFLMRVITREPVRFMPE
jgi:hypothetical protein